MTDDTTGGRGVRGGQEWKRGGTNPDGPLDRKEGEIVCTVPSRLSPTDRRRLVPTPPSLAVSGKRRVFWVRP